MALKSGPTRVLGVRLNAAEWAALDAHRGAAKRSEYARWLIRKALFPPTQVERDPLANRRTTDS